MVSRITTGLKRILNIYTVLLNMGTLIKNSKNHMISANKKYLTPCLNTVLLNV